jgi:predicted helicase
VFYNEIGDYARAEDKKNYLVENTAQNLPYKELVPQKNHWINVADNDFDDLMPLMNKMVKRKGMRAIFSLFSRGVETGRDEWIYDIDKRSLSKKMKYFCDTYNLSIISAEMNMSIKWTSSLEETWKSGRKAIYDANLINYCLIRPYYRPFYYSEKIFSH